MKRRITVTAWLQGHGIIHPSGSTRKLYCDRALTLEEDPVTGMKTVEFDEPDPRIDRATTKKES